VGAVHVYPGPGGHAGQREGATVMAGLPFKMLPGVGEPWYTKKAGREGEAVGAPVGAPLGAPVGAPR